MHVSPNVIDNRYSEVIHPAAGTAAHRTDRWSADKARRRYQSTLPHPGSRALEEQFSALGEKAKGLEGRSTELERRSAQLEEKTAGQEREISRRAAELDKVTAELQQRSSELGEARAELGETGARLGETQVVLGETRGALGEKAAALERALSQLEEREARLGEVGERLREVEGDRDRVAQVRCTSRSLLCLFSGPELQVGRKKRTSSTDFGYVSHACPVCTRKRLRQGRLLSLAASFVCFELEKRGCYGS